MEVRVGLDCGVKRAMLAGPRDETVAPLPTGCQVKRTPLLVASPHVPHTPNRCNFGSAHAWFVERASASVSRQRGALPKCDSGGSNLITPSWTPAGTNWTSCATPLRARRVTGTGSRSGTPGGQRAENRLRWRRVAEVPSPAFGNNMEGKTAE